MVVYEYVNPSETELLSSDDRVRVLDTSKPAATSAASSPVFMQVAMPRPAQISLSVPILKVSSVWNNDEEEFCRKGDLIEK